VQSRVSSFHGRTTLRRDVSGFILEDIDYAPRTSLPRHSHATAYISLLMQGRYYERIDRKRYHLRPDTILLHPAGETHSNEVPRSGARIFCIEFTPIGVQRLGVHNVDLSKRTEQRGGPAVRLGHRLYQQFRRTDTLSTLALEGLIFEILAELLYPEPAGEASREFPWINKVLAFVHANYRNPLPLAKIGQAAGIHPVHLARSFRRVHGQTLGEYVRRLRIEEARRRLIMTDLKLTEVGLECGFSDHSHFSRVFRRHVGVSPSRFRETRRR
jgi:AraC family transcriptional regulator